MRRCDDLDASGGAGAAGRSAGDCGRPCRPPQSRGERAQWIADNVLPHETWLRRWLQRRGFDHEAEDIVQESFVKAYLSLQDFKQEAAFYTWLYRIVYNMAIDYRRKVARRGGPTVEYDERITREGEKGNEENPAPSVLENRIEGPQEVLLRRERAEKLREALKGISEEHRVAITLREIDGLSYDEIARTTGVAKGTVMSRLHYARKKIQAAFEEE